METAALDLDHNWLPFTPIRDFREKPRLFARAEGVHYYPPEGKAVLELAVIETSKGHALDTLRAAVGAEDDDPGVHRRHHGVKVLFSTT